MVDVRAVVVKDVEVGLPACVQSVLAVLHQSTRRSFCALVVHFGLINGSEVAGSFLITIGVLAVLARTQTSHRNRAPEVLAVNRAVGGREKEVLVVFGLEHSAHDGFLAFELHEFNAVLIFEVGDKVRAGDVLDGERELDTLVNGFDEPLLDGVVLVLGPEPAHLLCSPLWNHAVAFNIHPELGLVKFFGGV